MPADLSSAVIEAIRFAARGRKLTIGILHLGHPEIVKAIAADGHRIAVIGDRFPLLYRLYEGFREPLPRPLIAEARFDALPIRPGSLDALVVTSGLPAGRPPLDTLRALRALLRESGLLVWPHPLRDGPGGFAGHLVSLLRRTATGPILRERITALAMEAGFREVGQVRPPGAWIPWVVTTGRAAPRPWERPRFGPSGPVDAHAGTV